MRVHRTSIGDVFLKRPFEYGLCQGVGSTFVLNDNHFSEYEFSILTVCTFYSPGLVSWRVRPSYFWSIYQLSSWFQFYLKPAVPWTSPVLSVPQPLAGLLQHKLAAYGFPTVTRIQHSWFCQVSYCLLPCSTVWMLHSLFIYSSTEGNFAYFLL